MSKNSNSGYYTLWNVFKLILFVNRLGAVQFEKIFLTFTQISSEKYLHERMSSYPLAPDCSCCPLVEHSAHCTLSKELVIISSEALSVVGENERSVRFLFNIKQILVESDSIGQRLTQRTLGVCSNLCTIYFEERYWAK
jgi:hypothetical protein